MFIPIVSLPNEGMFNAFKEAELENKFDVGRRGEEITFSCPLPPRVSREDALNFAAWLVDQPNDSGR